MAGNQLLRIGGHAMHIIGWIIFGLVVGIIARFLMPGDQPMGIVLTAALGVAGSFIGGAIASLVQGGSLTSGAASGWIGSILGALVLLFVYGMVAKRKA
jgi:uncharacterized membrane protein YeaQ/YmgE (transglycosylase-associated protein family)